MIIRTAVLEGSVADADRETFDRQMAETVMQAIATYPGIREVRLRRPAEAEAGAPPVYVQFDLYFDTLEAMHLALASEIRLKVRETIGAVMPLFKGRVYHLIMEEGAPTRVSVPTCNGKPGLGGMRRDLVGQGIDPAGLPGDGTRACGRGG